MDLYSFYIAFVFMTSIKVKVLLDNYLYRQTSYDVLYK